MNTLIVEDDFISRKFLQEMLKAYGRTDIAVNGVEAVDAVSIALAENDPYDLICLDIMMPEMDGHTALKKIRDMEEAKGIFTPKGVKILMTTALDDPRNVMDAFMGLCDGYLRKPITKQRLLKEVKNLGLL